MYDKYMVRTCTIVSEALSNLADIYCPPEYELEMQQLEAELQKMLNIASIDLDLKLWADFACNLLETKKV